MKKNQDVRWVGAHGNRTLGMCDTEIFRNLIVPALPSKN